MPRKPSTNFDPKSINLTEGELGEIDRAVGAEIRFRRILLGLSQQKVSAQIGLTFQQLQKYETGANRVSASRLFHLAKILRVTVSSFFTAVQARSDIPLPAPESPTQTLPKGVFRKPETSELVRAFYGIEDPRTRNAALRMISLMRGTKEG